MPIAKSDPNTGILEYAMGYLERELDNVVGLIDHARKQLGIGASSPAAAPAAPAAPASVAAAKAAPRKKRVLSAAARRKISAAQKLRWAGVRKAKAGKVSKTAKTAKTTKAAR